MVLVAFSLLALSLAVAVPSWTTELRREREQVSIDRAQQYVMGIRRYYHKFGAYPPNLDRLKETNSVHYLRRAWPDPLTKDGKWRFIHYGDLRLPAQKVNGATPAGQPEPEPASVSQPTDQGGAATAPPPAAGAATVGAPATPAPPAAASSRAAAGAGAKPAPAAPQFQLPPLGGALAASSEGSVVGAFSLTSNSGTGQRLGGGPIVGVASLDTRPAIHEFKGKDRPSDWLFIYDPARDRSRGGVSAAQAVKPAAPLGGPPAPQNPTSPPPSQP